MQPCAWLALERKTQYFHVLQVYNVGALAAILMATRHILIVKYVLQLVKTVLI
jgi:hypothetical protein